MRVGDPLVVRHHLTRLVLDQAPAYACMHACNACMYLARLVLDQAPACMHVRTRVRTHAPCMHVFIYLARLVLHEAPHEALAMLAMLDPYLLTDVLTD